MADEANYNSINLYQAIFMMAVLFHLSLPVLLIFDLEGILTKIKN
jgi:hypothetical protein